MIRSSQSTLAASVLALSLCFPAAASAQSTYDLAAFPFSYMGASLARAQLTTSASGSFSGGLAIASIFNSGSYSATLSGPAGVLTDLDNANSAWRLDISPAAAATLTIDSSKMTLSFATPIEFTEGVLMLQATDLRSVLQYRQSNNITDFNSANFNFDAIFGANSPTDYGTSFIFPAVVAIPEPSEAVLLSLGLLAGLIGRWSRRRGVQGAVTDGA